MSDDQISEAGRKARFELWERLGLDQVKHDLLNGGYRVVGGPPQVLDLAWQWVRMKEAAHRSRGVQLRRDPELIQKLLLKLENFPSRPGDVFIFTGEEPELAVDGYSAQQVTYHLEQVKEMGLIDSPGAQPMLGVTFRGLSSNGHDVLERQRALSASSSKPSVPPEAPLSRKVFIVHGHEGEPREAVAGFLRKIDFVPVILHEQTNRGRTIVEKFEDYSDVDFAVVLLTPDDVGGPKDGHFNRGRAKTSFLSWAISSASSAVRTSALSNRVTLKYLRTFSVLCGPTSTIVAHGNRLSLES